MKKNRIMAVLLLLANAVHAQPTLTPAIAQQLSRLPLHCITTEFPNKTSHLSDGVTDARLLPSELHPVFYGCLDWHSSVHGHWMLVKLLKLFPELPNKDSIISLLHTSFQLQKMKAEANYFGAYTSSNSFERTYGWAWLLKLDEELLTWQHPLGKKWHEALQPLTQKIVTLWKAFLPKQTYPNRTGVHGNTAFALCFAIDWARAAGDTAFEKALAAKARSFYLYNKNIPAYLEPDGADFFSPSLQAADAMRRVLAPAAFAQWLSAYYNAAGIQRIGEPLVVSDRNDFSIVHLDGLALSRAWCMKGIAASLPPSHPYKKIFMAKAHTFLTLALPQIFNGGYGGDHWLASFAVYALAMP